MVGTIDAISRVAEHGPSAAAWNADTLVLTCAKTGHDGDLAGSRKLATELATGILELSATGQCRAETMALLVRRLLSRPEGARFHLSFCVVDLRCEDARVFNCGGTGLLALRGGQVEIVAPPETLGRKFAAEGRGLVPSYLASAIVHLAGADCEAGDLSETVMPTGYEWIIAVDDPDLFDELTRASLDPGAWTATDVHDLVERSATRLHQKHRSWLALPTPRAR
jgi:hypothetical protein